MSDIEKVFTGIGGEFTSTYNEIKEKLTNIKAFVFDWDGVFNAGYKGQGISSPYAEPDAMGTNLLRFGYWLRYQNLPFVAIITGQNNQSAFQLANREHFHAVYYGFLHKIEAINHIQTLTSIQPSQIAFIFDDVLDVSAASCCGLRFLVRRKANPLFINYVKEHKLCDYITANAGAEHAVREVCELILGSLEQYTQVLNERIKYDTVYQTYLAARNTYSPVFYTKENKSIIQQG